MFTVNKSECCVGSGKSCFNLIAFFVNEVACKLLAFGCRCFNPAERNAYFVAFILVLGLCGVKKRFAAFARKNIGV